LTPYLGTYLKLAGCDFDLRFWGYGLSELASVGGGRKGWKEKGSWKGAAKCMMGFGFNFVFLLIFKEFLLYKIYVSFTIQW